MSVLEKAAPKARKGAPKPAHAAPKRLLIASGKGGCSKTTLTAHFAAAAAREGLRVAILDLDKQKSAARWWDERPEGLAEIFCHISAMADAVETLDEMTGYDLIVIDTPPSLDDYPAQTKHLIRSADFVLVPSGTGKLDTDSAIEFMATAQDFGAKAAFCLVMGRRGTKSLAEAQRRLNDTGPMCPVDVPHAEDLKTIMEVGATVLEVSGARAAKDVLSVWRFVSRELGLK